MNEAIAHLAQQSQNRVSIGQYAALSQGFKGHALAHTKGQRSTNYICGRFRSNRIRNNEKGNPNLVADMRVIGAPGNTVKGI